MIVKHQRIDNQTTTRNKIQRFKSYVTTLILQQSFNKIYEVNLQLVRLLFKPFINSYQIFGYLSLEPCYSILSAKKRKIIFFPLIFIPTLTVKNNQIPCGQMIQSCNTKNTETQHQRQKETIQTPGLARTTCIR